MKVVERSLNLFLQLGKLFRQVLCVMAHGARPTSELFGLFDERVLLGRLVGGFHTCGTS
jgi:hypothetical protein